VSIPLIDEHGNLHRASGPGGGQFEEKANARPAALAVPAVSAPELPAGDVVRGRVSAMWSELSNDVGRRDRGRLRESVFDVAIPARTSAQAPIVAEVAPDGVGGAPVQYRNVDGRLFRQAFGVKDRASGTVLPLPALRGPQRDYATAPLPTVEPGELGYDPARPSLRSSAAESDGRPAGATAISPLAAVSQAASAGAIVPIPADANWLRTTAAREAGMVQATNDREAAAALQQRMNGYAAVDGQVWQQDRPPAYRAPVPADAPFAGPVKVAVEPAPDMSRAAAPDGYYPSNEYVQAVQRTLETAKSAGVAVAPMGEEPPIQWLAELGLIDEASWRRGAPLQFMPSSALTIENWRERMVAFRSQILEHLPDAVRGDLGAFLLVPDIRFDFTALTASQQEEYRRYIAFAVAHGLT